MATFLENWVQEQARLTQPEKILWLDGSEEEARELVNTGLTREKIAGNNTFRELNGKEYPHSFFHRSHPTDVARTEHLTYVCLPNKEDAGPNNNWMAPEEAKAKMKTLFEGCMRGRTMYVIPYVMGH
ncbi:MAG: phosphoenolpyruvate carboxykinase (GTP), partial [Endomicrobiales bacterium]